MHADVKAGIASYTKMNLLLYDLYVFHYAAPYAWKCKAKYITDFYSQNISLNHLDVGVGTGYHLSKCKFPFGKPEISLLDLNRNSLMKAKRRLKNYDVKTYEANVLEQINIDLPMFDSIAPNYLLHCLPGNIKEKAIIFTHLKKFLNPGGILFGTTIAGGVEGVIGKRIQRKMNRKKIFSNYNDTLVDIELILSKNFKEHKTKQIGSIVFFKAKQNLGRA